MRIGLQILGAAVLLLPSLQLSAQHFNTGPCQNFDARGTSSWLFGREERACELRSTVLPLSNGEVNVANTNGGIEVIGENRRDVALEARVEAHGSSREDAESLLHKIRIVDDGTIHADGPQGSGWFHNGWSVSYRLRVPHNLNMQIHTVNGPVNLARLEGAIAVNATNGAIALTGVEGEVRAETVNGAIAITFDQPHWRGTGLFAKTVNGGIALKAPGDLSAHLVADTVNGAIAVGFPITVQGRINHHLDTDLGRGGPTLQLETVNGSIQVGRGSASGDREE